jgi:hypothetical protein
LPTRAEVVGEWLQAKEPSVGAIVRKPVTRATRDVDRNLSPRAFVSMNDARLDPRVDDTREKTAKVVETRKTFFFSPFFPFFSSHR